MKIPETWGPLARHLKMLEPDGLGAPVCSDEMKIQIKLDEKRKMVNTRFKIFGCGSATPSNWSVPEWVNWKMVEEASTIKNTDTAKELCLLPVKLHYSTLTREAIKAALADYKLKQERRGQVETSPWGSLLQSHGGAPHSHSAVPCT